MNLQMDFLKSRGEICLNYPGDFRKVICGSHAALDQLLVHVAPMRL